MDMELKKTLQIQDFLCVHRFFMLFHPIISTPANLGMIENSPTALIFIIFSSVRAQLMNIVCHFNPDNIHYRYS